MEAPPSASIGVKIDKANVKGDFIVQVGGQEKTAPKPVEPFEPEMVPVPAGAFVMGREPGPHVPSEEAPENRIELPVFKIGRYPVTNAQYKEFIQRNPKQDAPGKGMGWFIRKPPAARLDHPVIGVSWFDAVAYCAWLTELTGRQYRLPSEAEWEMAARGTDGRLYPWGDQWDEGLCSTLAQGTDPVSAHPEGVSPYGCEDLLGNVQEWTASLWGSHPNRCDYTYPYRRDDGREVQSAADVVSRSYLIWRGGDYSGDAGWSNLCTTRRGASPPSSQVKWRGFRVVLLPDEGD